MSNSDSNQDVLKFLQAAEDGDLNIINHFIDNKIDLNVTDKNGMTALLLASTFGHPKIIEQLRLAGANMNAINMDQKTAMMLAISNGQLDAIIELLNYKPNINLATPLLFHNIMGYQLMKSIVMYDPYTDMRMSKINCDENYNKYQRLIKAEPNIEVLNDRGENVLHTMADPVLINMIDWITDIQFNNIVTE